MMMMKQDDVVWQQEEKTKTRKEKRGFPLDDVQYLNKTMQSKHLHQDSGYLDPCIHRSAVIIALVVVFSAFAI